MELLKNETMNSLDIAKLTGKKHNHLMRDIRVMEIAWEKIGQSKFGQSSYLNSQNKKQPMYQLSKKECLYIATKFNDEARAKLILRWEELENKKVGGLIPQTFSQALMLASKQAEEIEVQKNKLQLQAPKVLFADAVVGSKSSCLVGELAKILNQNGVDIGQNRLFGWLRDNRYLISSGEQRNIPMQRYIEQGLFILKKGVRSGSDGVLKTTITTKVTGKGQQYFVNKFLSRISA